MDTNEMELSEGREAGKPARAGSGRGAALAIAMLPFPVLKLGPDGVVLESNGVLERDVRPRESFRGRRLADLVAPDAREAIVAAVGPGASGAQRRPLAFVPTSAGDGTAPKRTFDIVPDGDAVWLIGHPIECDLREAALRDAVDAKERFLATMSHELRTPLNAILGYAGLLRDGVYGPISDAQQRAIRSLVRRAHDLQLLIDDVLDLSRIESGRAELALDEFDPAAVLSEVQDAIAPFIREKALTITGRANFHGPVRLDRAKYKQIVLNLATNAVKFTPPHGEIDLSLEARGDRHFTTCVRDTGIGIARENLERIFEDFQQLDSGSTRRYQGLGVGLPIVRRIVELLGGAIEVDSEPGHGTTFRVTFPMHPESDTIVGELGAVPHDGEPSADPIVVAIDDDPEVLALLRDSLAPAHFRVVGALTGDRGKDLARILHPLAITLDIMMPEKDGWQVLREIKADPELARIPVIAMSIVSERSLGYSLGIADYLIKPVDRHVLIDALERLRRRAPGAAQPAQ